MIHITDHKVCDLSYVLGFQNSFQMALVQYVKCIIGTIKSYFASNNEPYDMAHIIWVMTYEIWAI